MGSGREAALTSGICSVFLSKILSATGRCGISLEMLNGFLRNKGSGSMHECSATVDLLDLDLITGKAEFYKSGAAPSYIFRDGNLFKLRSNTVPLGIIKELDAKKLEIDIGEDDIIVMVSDGVTQSKDECPWLFELLKSSVGSESLASIADMIVKRAKYEGADDDVSVIVLRVNLS
jgi:stage II sporulation protein E